MIGIYKITSPSRKVYIGQSMNVESRLADYRRLSSCHKQRRLYNSLKSHGAGAHIFEPIEVCNENQLLERERYWQDFYKVTGKDGLNCRLTTTADKVGKHSEKTIALMCIRQGGERNPNFGKRGPQTSTYGRKRSDSERAAIKAYQATRGQIIEQICLKTGAVVRSSKAREYAVDGYSQGNLSSCCTGRLKTYRGYAYRYQSGVPA